MKNNNTKVTHIPESLIVSGNVPHPADHPELFRQTDEHEYEYIGPDDFEETVNDERLRIDENEMDLYCEGRARGYELISENLLSPDVPEPVFAGIMDEFAQFLVEIGIADEFRGTLEHTEELFAETD